MPNRFTPRDRTPEPRNPAGSKIARRFAKHLGQRWRGEVVHTGALTDVADARRDRPKGWAHATAATTA